MIIDPYSYNGTLLNSTDYDTSIPRSAALMQIQANLGYVKRAGADPVFAGKDFQPYTLPLEILCLHDYTTLFESINQLFDVRDETPRQFIIQDTDFASSSDYVQYYVYATTKQVQGGHDGNMITVTLGLDDAVWQSVTQNSQTFATTSTTDSTSVTAAGNADSFPIFEITPTSQPSSDYLYNRYLRVLPTSTDPWANRFLDVLGTSDGTGLDTAALVTGGKMSSDGKDVRLFRDGMEVDAWLNGMDTTDTHLITVCDMPPARDMKLKTAFTSTDTVTQVELIYNSANKALITACPDVGIIVVDPALGSSDTEEFTYTSRTITSTKLAFNVNSRAVRGTTAAAHSSSDNVRFLPYNFNLVYGNPAAVARVTDDTRKPIQELTSRNTSLIYNKFGDEDGLRPGLWEQANRKVSSATLSRSGYFTSTDDAGDTDPFTSAGIAAYTYQSAGLWRNDTIILSWVGFFPDKVSSVSATGQQTQSSTSWPTVALQRSPDKITWTNLWTVATQVSSDFSTWTDFTKATSDATIPANQDYLRFVMTGSIVGTTDIYAKAGLNSITVGLTNPPHVIIGAENNNYQLNCTIRNETTGDFMTIVFPMELNTILYVDTDPDFPTAKYKGQIVNGVVSLSSIRSAWLKLQPGANTIGYETLADGGASDVSIVIKWRDRMNFF